MEQWHNVKSENSDPKYFLLILSILPTQKIKFKQQEFKFPTFFLTDQFFCTEVSDFFKNYM